ncbi:MAG: PEP-CTERM sorting domain-containing protein, partial [Isosphaeraceae bacterium]
PAFLTNGYSNTLVNLDTSLTLVPSTTNGGRTTAQSLLVVQPVPEPASIVVFGLSTAGLVWYRRRRQIA